MNLELTAMRWLWLEKKCLVVLEERTPGYMMGQPDVLGITAGRYMIEIETKRSVADFRADAKKSHRINREFYIEQQPRQFYYMMPPELVEKLKDEIPSWAGLMTSPHDNQVEIIKIAPVNEKSKKLGPKACARLARQMTNHMMTYVIANNSIRQAFRSRVDFSYVDWVCAEKGTYEI